MNILQAIYAREQIRKTDLFFVVAIVVVIVIGAIFQICAGAVDTSAFACVAGM